jgi:GT2 family glycosyltransferase
LKSAEVSEKRTTLAVGIATAGRREMLRETLLELARQDRLPDEVIVCPATPADVDEAHALSMPYPVKIVHGRRGSCAQRNRIIEAASEFDLLVFFDDDFFPCRDYLAELERAFEDPQAIVVTGRVIADGAQGPGISSAEARELIAAAEAAGPKGRCRPIYNGYGCNMAVRMSATKAQDARFDEALPLYGWLEDVDFTRGLASRAGGMVFRTGRCRGVHLGTKAGRTAGVRFGYSQIANPLHIFHKGVLTPGWVFNQMLRNILSNIARSARPEPWVDRRGRLRGNVLALRDLAGGRLRPDKILELT